MNTTRGTWHGARWPGAFVALVTAALLATGCSASSGGDGASDAGGDMESAELAPEAATDDALGSAADGAAEAAAGTATAAREVITTGTATLVTDDPIDATSRIATLTEESGGRVELRGEHRASGDVPASARLTLRLPADAVNRTLDTLRGFGDLVDVSLAKEDVTATGRDLDARIGALETSTARLTQLMAQAGDVADLLQVEQELAMRQADLDALRAQRADLSDRVAMSTLDVYVVADTEAVAEPATGFRGGLQAGWRALTATVRVSAVVLGAVFPWLVVAGVVAGAWRSIVVLRRRRRAADATASPAVAPAPTAAPTPSAATPEPRGDGPRGD